MRLNNRFHLLFIALIFISLFSVGVSGQSERDLVSSLIDEADRAVVSAYDKVLVAERAGADVSLLAGKLNNACDLLVQARVSYDNGDFDNARRYADLCIGICSGVEDEAVYLKDIAEVRSFWGLRINITYSVSAIILIVCFSYLGWEAFRKYYYGKALSRKPELVSEEDN